VNQSWLKKKGIGKSIRKMVKVFPPGIRSRIDDAITVLGYTPYIPEEELKACYRGAIERLVASRGEQGLGDYLEFGVSHGSSLACMSRVVTERGLDRVRLFGFDSFQGLPASAAEEDDGVWKPGDFHSSLNATRRILAGKGVNLDRVTLIDGWFSDTLTPELIAAHRIEKASVIMVDCDLYSSAREALDFCGPLIRDAAVVLFDDWHSGGLATKGMGEKKAFDEFMAANPALSAERLTPYSPASEVFLIERRA
jgi:hypothetical protein